MEKRIKAYEKIAFYPANYAYVNLYDYWLRIIAA